MSKLPASFCPKLRLNFIQIVENRLGFQSKNLTWMTLPPQLVTLGAYPYAGLAPTGLGLMSSLAQTGPFHGFVQTHLPSTSAPFSEHFRLEIFAASSDFHPNAALTLGTAIAAIMSFRSQLGWLAQPVAVLFSATPSIARSRKWTLLSPAAFIRATAAFVSL